MHATDILGYTYDADTYCVPCTEREYPGATDWRVEGFDPGDYLDSEGNMVGPIFADSEWDAPEHCGRCRVFLGTNLTADGYAYVVDALARADGDSDVLATWYNEYSQHFDADDWQFLAEAWLPMVQRWIPFDSSLTVVRGSVRLSTGTLDYPTDADSQYSERDYPSVTFAFDRPTDADTAYRPFRKDGAK